jgi:hypothetical protein
METFNICKYCELKKSINEFDTYKKKNNTYIRNRCIDCRKKYDMSIILKIKKKKVNIQKIIEKGLMLEEQKDLQKMQILKL